MVIQYTDGLTLSSLALQSFVAEASSPNELTTGLAILLVGFFGILTLATVILNSPAALIGEAATVTFFVLSLVGVTNVRLFYLVGAIHGLVLAATGVFYDK
jgi:hypothetical protein